MKLLAAIDLHDRARDVVAEIASWARALHARIDLAFVDEYRYTAQLLPDPHVRLVVEQQWEQVQQANLAALEELALLLPEAIRGGTRYLSGRPAEELAAAAADYDGLIVATHGRTGLGHVLLGSVAERVVRVAPCPVLVLRLPTARGR